MGKLVTSLIVTVMLVFLTACGNKNAQGVEPIKASAAADNESAPGDTDSSTEYMEDNSMRITAGDTTFTATLADNSSAQALKELLVKGSLTINMSDYAGMEKVGPIGTSLPRNDEQISTGAGGRRCKVYGGLVTGILYPLQGRKMEELSVGLTQAEHFIQGAVRFP